MCEENREIFFQSSKNSLNRYQAEEIYILEVNAEGFYEVAVWWTTHRTPIYQCFQWG